MTIERIDDEQDVIVLGDLLVDHILAFPNECAADAAKTRLRTAQYIIMECWTNTDVDYNPAFSNETIFVQIVHKLRDGEPKEDGALSAYASPRFAREFGQHVFVGSRVSTAEQLVMELRRRASLDVKPPARLQQPAA